MGHTTKHLELGCPAISPVRVKIGAHDNRPSDMSNSLIKRIHDAVRAGYILETFTARDIEEWMIRNNIRKEDGTRYKQGYAANLLSNSVIKGKKTKNRNSKWLDRRFNNSKGVHEYWFAD